MGGRFRAAAFDPRPGRKRELERIIGESNLGTGEKAEALKDINLNNLEEVASRFQKFQTRRKRTEDFREKQKEILTDRPGQKQTILTQSRGPTGSTGGTLLTGG